MFVYTKRIRNLHDSPTDKKVKWDVSFVWCVLYFLHENKSVCENLFMQIVAENVKNEFEPFSFVH